MKNSKFGPSGFKCKVYYILYLKKKEIKSALQELRIDKKQECGYPRRYQRQGRAGHAGDAQRGGLAHL